MAPLVAVYIRRIAKLLGQHHLYTHLTTLLHFFAGSTRSVDFECFRINWFNLLELRPPVFRRVQKWESLIQPFTVSLMKIMSSLRVVAPAQTASNFGFRCVRHFKERILDIDHLLTYHQCLMNMASPVKNKLHPHAALVQLCVHACAASKTRRRWQRFNTHIARCVTKPHLSVVPTRLLIKLIEGNIASEHLERCFFAIVNYQCKSVLYVLRNQVSAQPYSNRSFW